MRPTSCYRLNRVGNRKRTCCLSACQFRQRAGNIAPLLIDLIDGEIASRSDSPGAANPQDINLSIHRQRHRLIFPFLRSESRVDYIPVPLAEPVLSIQLRAENLSGESGGNLPIESQKTIGD